MFKNENVIQERWFDKHHKLVKISLGVSGCAIAVGIAARRLYMRGYADGCIDMRRIITALQERYNISQEELMKLAEEFKPSNFKK